jgi:hypothetical protein
MAYDFELLYAREKELAKQERIRERDFLPAIALLTAAREYFEGLPRPWMNDCIRDSIDGIDSIMESLKGRHD